MSLLDTLLDSLSGKDEGFTPPSSLCPGSRPIGPAACAECLPYKEKLKEWLYDVEPADAACRAAQTACAGKTAAPAERRPRKTVNRYGLGKTVVFPSP